MADQFISVREAAQTLGISEKRIMDFVDTGHLQAYRIAGQFLRLKKSEVLTIRQAETTSEETTLYKYTLAERIKDFIYYNDFYLISIAVICFLIFLIFRM